LEEEVCEGQGPNWAVEPCDDDDDDDDDKHKIVTALLMM
jgi:hypothetical protein